MDSQVELKHGWNLQAAPQVEAFINEAKDEIYWGAKVYAKANYNSEHAKGDFVKGLWRLDVIELFVRDLNSKSYQEFNLAPSGAYWSAVFKDNRVPADNHERELGEVDIHSQIDGDSWFASMRIRKKQLGVGSDNLLINMTAVLSTVTESCYLSLLPTQSVNPDFHGIISGIKS